MKACKRLCALLVTLAASLALPLCAHGLDAIDLTRGAGLTLSLLDGETPLSGAQFSIYPVAEMDNSGALTVTEAFRGYPVDIQTGNDAAWRQLAATLEGYVLRDGIAATDSGKTDARGALAFPTGGGRLTPGLYLVLGQRHTQNGTRYDPSPFMVLLPAEDESTGAWIYDMHTTPKFDATRLPDEPEDDTIERKVLKVWKDSGENRPGSVTVQLLQDGTVYDTVTLSAKNNWRYTWTELDAGSVWRVVETAVPEGYSVTVSREGVTFVVTNTATPDQTDLPNTPQQPDAPGNPDVPDAPETPKPDTPKQPTLPQTGQLWWPVPVLAAAGLLCIAAGLLRRRGNGDET